MKKHICNKCIAFGGKKPCILLCEDDMTPTHCPHDDSAYPNSDWVEAPVGRTWHDVVKECEGILHLEGTAETPWLSNLPNILRELKREVDTLRCVSQQPNSSDPLVRAAD